MGEKAPSGGTIGPTLTTSVYETHLGLAALSWSRALFGLSLRADLRLPSSSSFGSASSSSAVSSSDNGFDTHSFRIRPWILWKRRGTKRFHVKDKDLHRKVDFAWDLSRAVFAGGGGAEPAAGFFVAVAVDGEMFLVVGDFPSEEAYKKAKVKKPISSEFRKGSPANPVLVSRSEHVVVPVSDVGRPYKTSANIGGKRREISVELSGGKEKDARLSVGFDGKRVLQVKRLRWKFRGNERVLSDHRIQVSWDVYNWLFAAAGAGATPAKSPEMRHAMLVFRFDRQAADEVQGRLENSGGGGGSWGMYGLRSFGHSDRSFSSASTVSGGGWGRRGKKPSLLKTSSSSSLTSTASTASSSSVLDWASAEETELKESDGFFLVLYIWKR